MAIDKKTLKLFSQDTSSGDQFAITGTWMNELGSTMTIQSTSGNEFSGSYTSQVSSGGGSVTGALSGTMSGDSIAFTVNWAPYESVTGWTGLLLGDGQGGGVIYALWNLASEPASQDDWWQSILAGADIFFPDSS